MRVHRGLTTTKRGARGTARSRTWGGESRPWRDTACPQPRTVSVDDGGLGGRVRRPGRGVRPVVVGAGRPRRPRAGERRVLRRAAASRPDVLLDAETPRLGLARGVARGRTRARSDPARCPAGAAAAGALVGAGAGGDAADPARRRARHASRSTSRSGAMPSSTASLGSRWAAGSGTRRSRCWSAGSSPQAPCWS